MTTIAWDGKYLAADSRETSAGCAMPVAEPKIKKLGDVYVACAGPAEIIEEFEQWVAGGRNPDETPAEPEGDDGFQAFVFEADGRMMSYTDEMKAFPCPAGFAIGSGWKSAMTLMSIGLSAEQAVKTICEKNLDVYTGLPVVVVEPKITQRKRTRKN